MKLLHVLDSLVVMGGMIACVSSHGAVVSPRCRQSIDYKVGVNEQQCSNITGKACNNGQAAFWYSQGCFIGCPTCDNVSGRRQVDLCGLGMKATLNDPKYRSVNRNATAGSPQDIYKHNPWRAPGSAPTGDVCGYAGGTPYSQDAPEAGDYLTTEYAHHGMKGSLLKELPTGTQWTIGATAEVTWDIRNNHGGGYSYRLCPATSNLTEDCFQQHHLDFDTNEQAVVFPNGTLYPVDGTFVNAGTFPSGSMWSMMPMPPTLLGPRCLPGPNDTASTPYACKKWEAGLVDGPCTPCPGTPGSDCSRCDNNNKPAFPPPCENCEGVSWHGYAVRDILHIPQNLAPGKYVLGFRYDCEATAQVWVSCSDIELVVQI